MIKKAYLIFLIALVNQSLLADEVKKADLAGAWYPAGRNELTAMIEGYLSQALPQRVDGRVLGLISPHAGCDYSGRTAGFGFKEIADENYKTIVIVGFSHRKFFDGVSVYDRGSFETPVGAADVDADFARALISRNKKFSFNPDLFSEENSIEVIVPFVQIAQKGAKIVPVAFGTQDYGMCQILAEALADVIKDREDVLIIASSDMSHYHAYAEANAMDNFTMNALRERDPGKLYAQIRTGQSELCGAAPVTTLLIAMKILGADGVKILKYENSGDVTGEKDRVVGYVSAVFYKSRSRIPDPGSKINPGLQISNSKTMEVENNMLNEKQRKRLLEIARTTMEEYVRSGKAPEFTEADPALSLEKGAFVTLHYKGNLRGCIGNIIGRGPLYKTVRDMAIESSANDHRFSPVAPGELKDIKVEISVLSVPERTGNVNDIVMGRHGVIVKRGFRSGVFLPQVAAETGWSREEFLSELCSQKAGLSPDAWKDPSTEIYIFTAEVFGEE